MKKIIVLSLMVIIGGMAFGQSYDKLWKSVQDAHDKDLPQTEARELQRIVDRARKRGDYGHLLKAELMRSGLEMQLSPDSTARIIATLEQEAVRAEQKDGALAAVYWSVLGNLYGHDPVFMGSLTNSANPYDEAYRKSSECYARSLSNPTLLAATKAGNLAPMLRQGADSYIFGNDLLSVLGYEANNMRLLHDWYDAHGMRAAAMVTGLNLLKTYGQYDYNPLGKNAYIAQLDSLIDTYGDLIECGEVAIARYQGLKQSTNVKAETLVDYIDEALARWGTWKRMNVLRNARSELVNPHLSVMVNRHWQMPGRTTNVKVSEIRNVKELTMRLSRLNLDPADRPDLQYWTPEDEARLVVPGTIVEVKRSYEGHKEWDFWTDSLQIDGMSAGVYLLEFFADAEKMPRIRQYYYVSSLYLMYENLPDSRTRYAVVDAATGQPVTGAKVMWWTAANRQQGNSQQLKAYTMDCDDRGEVVANHGGQYPRRVWAYTDDDRGMACHTMPWSSDFSYWDAGTQESKRVHLFTDRQIYRPGQTVHVAAVAYSLKREWETEVLKDTQLTLQLYDANGKLLKTAVLTTDDFGTATTDFVLPDGGLTGTFRISSTPFASHKYISVEEYKRPSFEVDFDPYTEKYEVGETIVVKGHARSYAGVPIQDAKVSYKVKRNSAWWCWWRGDGDRGSIIRESSTVTDGDGTFLVQVPLQLPSDDVNGFFDFNIVAEVTDQAGETHVGEMSLPLGRKNTSFFCNLPEMAEKDSLKEFTFALKNATGQNIDASVRYTLDDSAPRWVRTNTPVSLKGHHLTSGRHVLRAECGSDTLRVEFVLFGLDDVQPCVPTHDWFYQNATEFPRESSGQVSVQVGSSDENVHILYNIIAGNKVLESGVIDLNNAIETRRFSYDEDYGTGLLLTYAWVKDGTLHRHAATIERPKPDKRLLLTWNTFRDRLKPGQKELWTLSVKQPDGKPAAAQLMATMYDKSLEQLARFSWSYSLGIGQSLPFTQWHAMELQQLSGSSRWPFVPSEVPNLEFTTFDSELMDLYLHNRGLVVMYDTRHRMLSVRNVATLEAQPAYEPMTMMAKSTAEEAIEGGADTDSQAGGKDSGTQVQMRENFAETAFFYPQHKVGADGRVKLEFTLPESVTTWKIVAMAHDQAMNHGWLEGECEAKKEVMVQPNLPRFVREGDAATIAVRLFNTAEKNIGGKVRLQLLRPDEESVLTERSQTFSVAQGQSATATFALSPDDLPEAGLYVCRVVATGSDFSDGEQHYLPILPATEWVTRTRPITQHEVGVETVDLKAMFPEGSTQQKLTVEYTNNPAWLMVQALPFVGSTDEKNAVSLAAAYYANTIGKYLLDQSPTAKATFEQWKQEGDIEGSLASNLQKNEELKELTLNETPWVAESESETEQKQALAHFFDENMLGERRRVALEKLQSLQNSDGAFCWWPGMPGSPRMTGMVLEFMARLNQLAGHQEETRKLIDRAMTYVGKVVTEEVDVLKKREQDKEPVSISSYHALQWVYINALLDRKMTDKERAAADYLLKHLEKEIRSQSLCAKARMAVVFQRWGQTQKAREYVQSLKEYSVFSESMGRYYDTPRAAYSWFDFRIPTQTAVIEALLEVTPDDQQTTDEMKRWLLQEKRTQCWDTPINSVNAVYAFLNGRSNILDKKEPVQLAIDGKPVPAPRSTAGIGYVKTTIAPAEGSTLTATKTIPGTSWGAVYAQFMQPVSDVEAQHEGLGVTRVVLKDGKSMTEGQVLHVGDKVRVVITVKADRDYDFVQLVDKRAACFEPMQQTSGYRNGYYMAPKDYTTNYYFEQMRKGTHVVERDFYVDRAGQYQTGTCVVQCAYSPEFMGRDASLTFKVE